MWPSDGLRTPPGFRSHVPEAQRDPSFLISIYCSCYERFAVALRLQNTMGGTPYSSGVTRENKLEPRSVTLPNTEQVHCSN
jgi:hypothetical protein